MNAGDPRWLPTLRRYIGLMVPLSLGWELAQLPLYTLADEPIDRIAFAIAHCTLGDVLIASATLLLALLVAAPARWPAAGFVRVLVLTTVLGVAYTIFSEWLNLVVRQSWAYTAAMPRLPWLGTGLAPLLQWLLLPPLALVLSRSPRA